MDRIAFVCPRYETAQSGGAEFLARSFAEQLTRRKLFKADILTTCARDHFTWENHYPEGAQIINGVNVIRFKVDPRDTQTYLRIQDLISRDAASKEEELLWITNSVRSSAMREYIRANENSYRYFFFLPYLFGTTYDGMKLVPEKSILIPCLHNEGFARLSIVKDMFLNARGIIFNAPEEARLAGELYGTTFDRYAGVGIEAPASETAIAPEELFTKYGISKPYLLYIGRKEAGKNAPMIADYFSAYRKHTGSGINLVMAGSGELDSSNLHGVTSLPFLDEAEKTCAYRECLALCQPSTNESFSIVMMEAWLQGRPCLVHENCAVTKGHCLRSNGGLCFRDYHEFYACLEWLIENAGQADTMGRQGRRYVLDHYSWDRVISRFTKALNEFGPA